MTKLLQQTDDEIRDIVGRLGDAPMNPSSHGYQDFRGMSIREAAFGQAAKLLSKSENEDRSAAVSLMMVVLAANRNYEIAVRPHVVRMRAKYTELSFEKLYAMVSKTDFRDFKEVWGHADEKKFDTLKRLLEAILNFPAPDGASDYQRMHMWAKNAKLSERKDDPIGKLKNVGVATFQHLRMVFGVDTVKPDQRVLEVLDIEFGEKLRPELAVQAVEEIAGITGLKVIEVDQIFVKYGSGYYLKQ